MISIKPQAHKSQPTVITKTMATDLPYVVVVTGASRGLGQQFVRALCERKNVLIFACMRDLKRSQFASPPLRTPSCSHVIEVAMDVSDVISVRRAFEVISKHTRHIDLLINNAGISVPSHPYDPVELADPLLMATIYNTNVVGPLTVTQFALPYLRAATTDPSPASSPSHATSSPMSHSPSFTECDLDDEKMVPPMTTSAASTSTSVASKGATSSTRVTPTLVCQRPLPKVINVTSNLGSIENTGEWGNAGYTSYRASKAALNMLTRTWAADWKEVAIFIAQSPGWASTDMGRPEAPLTPQQSVTSMIKLIDGYTVINNGHFYEYDGTKIPW